MQLLETSEDVGYVSIRTPSYMYRQLTRALPLHMQAI